MERINAMEIFERSYNVVQCFALSISEERTISKIANQVILNDNPFLEIREDCHTDTLIHSISRLHTIISKNLKQCLQEL